LSKKLFILLILVIYIGVLTKLIMIKHPTMAQHILNSWSYESMIRHFEWYTNFTPFKTITSGLNYASTVRIMIYNIIAFIPLGFLMPILFNNHRYRAILTLLSGIFLSLFYEVVQVITRLGSGDIDDVILNSLGTLLGYLSFRLLTIIYQRLIKSAHAQQTVLN
jgi:glycopeptide antibiotics resistance protein